MTFINNLKKEKLYTFLVILLYFAIAILALHRGINIGADSKTYLNSSIYRSPVYPLFLQLSKLISVRFFNQFVIIIQLLLGFYGVSTFSCFLKSQFRLNKRLVFLMIFILMTPYFIAPYIANRIMTEPLAYPLFLLTITYLLQGILTKNLKKLIISFFLLALLTLTRTQFLFMYPLLVAILFYLCFYKIFNKREMIKISFLSIIILFSAFMAEKSYNYIVFGKFIRVPFTGIQLAGNLIYVSSSKDSIFLSDLTERRLFIKMMSAAEKGGTALNTFQPLGKESFINHYRKSMNSIYWEIIYNTFRNEYPLQKQPDLWINIDKTTLSITKNLISQKREAIFRLYLENIYYGLGGMVGFWGNLSILLYLICLFIKGNHKNETIFLLFAIICHLLNTAFVALVEPVTSRYIFYTEILLFVVTSSILLSLIEHKDLSKPGV